MLRRNEKEAIVENLKTQIDSAKAVFLTNLIGIPSNDAVAIRKKIREANGKIFVARNTLFGRAVQGTYLEGLCGSLKGTNAMAFAYEDAPAVAKALYDAGEANELVDLKGGFLGDQELSKAEIVALAKLPSRDQMLATLLATFNAPVSAFVRTMDAIKRQKEEGGEAAAAPAEATE